LCEVLNTSLSFFQKHEKREKLKKREKCEKREKLKKRQKCEKRENSKNVKKWGPKKVSFLGGSNFGGSKKVIKSRKK